MENIDKILEKLKEARKTKGYSHENMATELGISQAAYSNIEKNDAKLTVERLLKISEIFEKPVYYFFETSPNNIYNQENKDNCIRHIDNLYQDNKDTNAKLVTSYESTIQNLKEEIVFFTQYGFKQQAFRYKPMRFLNPHRFLAQQALSPQASTPHSSHPYPPFWQTE